MILAPQRHLTLFASFLAASALAFGSSITVNGTCEAGSCPVPPGSGALTSGSSIPVTAFNFTYTFGNGDIYDVIGDYSAANSVAGTSIGFNVTVVYEGTTPSQADVLTIDDFQNYTVTTGLSGTYFENTAAAFGGGLGSGSSLSAQLSYNGTGLGELGPFSAAGSQSKSTFVSLSGTALAADFQFTFDFGAGSKPGSYISTVPEPAGIVPVAALLGMGLAIAAFRRAGQRTKSID